MLCTSCWSGAPYPTRLRCQVITTISLVALQFSASLNDDIKFLSCDWAFWHLGSTSMDNYINTSTFVILCSFTRIWVIFALFLLFPPLNEIFPTKWGWYVNLTKIRCFKLEKLTLLWHYILNGIVKSLQYHRPFSLNLLNWLFFEHDLPICQQILFKITYLEEP